MGRAAGSKNRNYPPVTLSEALRVPRVIEDQASGMDLSRLTLAELLDLSPSSSVFRDLVAASRFYGLTTGGVHADEFKTTDLGSEATGGDEVAIAAALKRAVLEVPPYRKLLETFSGKKVPSRAAMREFLLKSAEVPADRVEECMDFILKDAETAGFLRELKGSQYIDFTGVPRLQASGPDPAGDEEASGEPDDGQLVAEHLSRAGAPPATGSDASEARSDREPDRTPRKVFIAHGKNRTPLEQLKKALDQFKVSYAVAVDEPNKGRPISRKVANLMKDECSSGIFIFTADERFERTVGEKTEEVWRPSENVVFELGAASILYENRIVIFKEKGVSFPSDFQDLGYIEFEKDKLVAELGSLFAELVALDILEVRAKS